MKTKQTWLLKLIIKLEACFSMRYVTYLILSKFKDSIAFVHSSTLAILTDLVGDTILLVIGSLLGV